MNLREYNKSLMELQSRVYSPIAVNDATIDIIEVGFENPGGAVYCPPHTHTWFEFNYVVSGSFFTKFGTEVRKVEEKMFFLIPPGVEHSHSYNAEDPHNGIFMRWNFERNEAFGGKDAVGVFKQLEYLYSWNGKCRRDEGAIGNLLEQMLKRATQDSLPAGLQMDFVNVLLKLSSLAGPDQGERKPDRDIPGKTLLRKVESYLNDINLETFDVHALAASLHMSYGNLARVYKKYSGQTLQSRLSTILVEKSLLLMEQTDCSIGEISEKLGFSNQYYFSKVFKEKKRLSPREYRNLLKKED